MTLDGPSSHRVARKRQQRKDRILEAAFAAVAESGPAEFSLNQLARDLDYTPGALYWYFPSKDALVAAVQRTTMEELAGWLERERQTWEASPAVARCKPKTRALSTLLHLGAYYLELEQTAPRHARIIAFSLDPRVWLGDEEIQTLAPVLSALFAPTASTFRTAHDCGALSGGEPVTRAIQYWAALQGAMQTAKLGRLNPALFNARSIGMSTAEALLRGWGASASSLERARSLVEASSPVAT